ncbi:MAG: helix-turn-helix transcriptional regulator [Marinobacterium sp.]|nr:helix-turn-helix transcriptional regulator [Marinobacterium sp.]
MKKHHFKTIAEQNAALGIRPPEHPLIDLITMNSATQSEVLQCQHDFSISADFYSISLKRITAGEIFYGRTRYDCSDGTMLFMAPQQTIASQGIRVESVARTLCFHEDFVRGYPLQAQLKSYRFFSYAVNEALHLSPREHQQVERIFDAIEAEYHNNYDAFTHELILSQINTLLQYANRYYHRQFLMRKESSTSVYEQFINILNQHMDSQPTEAAIIPTIDQLASQMNMTNRYLSDALKAETGKTTKDWIHRALIDRSKDLLLSTDSSVATIAYDLGFEYPQYFSRLFKSKEGMTPTQYRARKGVH